MSKLAKNAGMKERTIQFTLIGNYYFDRYGSCAALCVAGVRRYVELPTPSPHKVWAVFSQQSHPAAFAIDWSGFLIEAPDVTLIESTVRELRAAYLRGYRYVRLEYEA